MFFDLQELESPLAIAEWIEIAVELERDKYKTVSASDSGVDWNQTMQHEMQHELTSPLAIAEWYTANN